MNTWMHIDLKCLAPQLDTFVEDLSFLADQRFDGVLIEWENMFPFRCVGEALSPDAYSADEVRTILDECRRLGLASVPLVQTLGHLSWLLTHPCFIHLREFSDRAAQIRACDGQSWDILGAMVDELLDAHAESPFVHLGADEVAALARIDRDDCSAARDGPSAVYLRHMAPLFEQVRSAGKRPIIWADMLLQHPSGIGELPRDVAVMDWSYLTMNRYERSVRLWSGTVADESNLADIEGDDAMFVPYLRRSPLPPRHPFPATGHRPAYYLNAFAASSFLRDNGFEVIGAPTIQCAHDTLAVPAHRWHAANCAAWAQAASDIPLSGLCCTSWSIRGQLREMGRGLTRAFAAAARKNGQTTPAGLDRAIWRPIAGRQAARVASADSSRYPTPNWSNETRPVAFDTDRRRFRPDPPVDERLRAAMEDPRKLPDDAPTVVETRADCESLETMIEALTRCERTTESEAWSIGCRELWLRHRMLLAGHHHLGLGGSSNVDGDMRRRFEGWGAAAIDFVRKRYVPGDAALYELDRVRSLELALDEL